MKLKRSIAMPMLVAVVGLTTGGWLLQRGVDPQTNMYFQARLLEEVVRRVSADFVEEVDQERLYRMAIDGMMDELGDPHSVFMTPEDYENLRLQTQGEYGGLGIEIDVRNGWLTVLSPLPNSPAERVGLQAGDRIIRVEGESTEGWTTDRAVSVLRGPKGSTVSITVARVGIEEPIPFDITRAEIELTAVPASYMVDDQVGYIELLVFSETAVDSLVHAIDRLREQGATKLVLDMRRNTGGLLDQGMAVADLFLARRQLILETRGRSPGQSRVFRASRDDQYPDMPVAVLLGRQSASATEIVAGAVQDHDRAVLIGETSFGKGSVQTLYELPGRNILKLTTARWYTPSGRSIQKPYGIDGAWVAATADAAVPLADNATTGLEDTTSAGVPIYRTDAGRRVLGGGGITPDLVVRDTLSRAEQALVRAIRDDVALFNNVLYEFSVEYSHGHPELQPGFPVTEAMIEAFRTRLAGEGLEIDRGVFHGASSFLTERLANEISVAAFGRQEGWKRLTENDPQLRIAVELLNAASSSEQLFALLPGYAAERGLPLGAEYQMHPGEDALAHPY
jgi:carboxyl-terminal processing protease